VAPPRASVPAWWRGQFRSLSDTARAVIRATSLLRLWEELQAMRDVPPVPMDLEETAPICNGSNPGGHQLDSPEGMDSTHQECSFAAISKETLESVDEQEEITYTEFLAAMVS